MLLIIVTVSLAMSHQINFKFRCFFIEKPDKMCDAINKEDP